MIAITKTAQEHFVQLLSQQEAGTQIRVFVLNPGTDNAECGITYCAPYEVTVTDTEVKFSKLSVFIDAISAPYLHNSEIDYIVNQLDAQLILKAPHARTHTINDNAPLIERVNALLEVEINPKLSQHGGKVFVSKITTTGYAILQFSGGCNGCSMVNITIKNNIEKELLHKFPELKGVKDITEHHHGKHSFY
ncbi:Fe/S biogenesis protein NfuA [Candidatus Erwinia haradaeae]|uniref:Fe/S biogenesis protein NfuA n=1 Tax=Candidatus Erwinia haradaeae TaxID=1922217 RepID=A0A451DD33_9GAMM|nr:Fe-S biogenesis protein NfuA [Candidatus Erwinia haradaeae]VFP84373.1 Fe/S biogenesis protein NfuA [Candidatus Erwinia haradaeae]